MSVWQLQQAKAKMSELVKQAQIVPQEITLHGKPVAVVISHDSFQRLLQSQRSLVDFMRQSPLYDDDDVVLERDTSPTRDVSF